MYFEIKGGINVEKESAIQCITLGHRAYLAGITSEGYDQIGEIKAAP
jgi:hypothetical protein